MTVVTDETAGGTATAAVPADTQILALADNAGCSAIRVFTPDTTRRIKATDAGAHGLYTVYYDDDSIQITQAANAASFAVALTAGRNYTIDLECIGLTANHANGVLCKPNNSAANLIQTYQNISSAPAATYVNATDWEIGEDDGTIGDNSIIKARLHVLARNATNTFPVIIANVIVMDSAGVTKRIYNRTMTLKSHTDLTNLTFVSIGGGYGANLGAINATVMPNVPVS